jgi:GAF domain
MSIALPEPLLALAAAISGDGGAAVLSVLQAILAQAAPHDAAEVALRRNHRTERFRLGPDSEGEPFTADDVLDRVLEDGAPFRADDLEDAEPFPRTRERMRAQGLRSFLAVPFTTGGGPEGMVVVARRHGWAFVGASLHTLCPVAGMAGLALDRALALTLEPPRASAGPPEVVTAAPPLPPVDEASVREPRADELVERLRALEAQLAQVTVERDALRLECERERSRAAGDDAVVEGGARAERDRSPRGPARRAADS